VDSQDDLLIEALREAGCDAQRVVWGGPVDADVCVIRSVWDYFERRDEFLRWTDHLSLATPVWNAPAVLRWNSRKSYLADLERAGVPVPPTEVLRPGDDVVDRIAARGWIERVIVKPIVGVGAIGSLVAGAGDHAKLRSHVATLFREGDVLLQPFLSRIGTDGETSLVFFDGALSHAVRKIPAEGDYRAHPYWGARVHPIDPTDVQLSVAAQALRAIPEQTLYARVDLVPLDDGAPALMELELIEPYLFLDQEGAARFARSIVRRLELR
jgi:glutathione synthase/RimK-type ligase-like ATP-grasp enzyme